MAYRQVFDEAADQKLSVGTVHVYILSPDGKVADSQSVKQAQFAAPHLEFLNRQIARFAVTPGQAIGPPTPQVRPPKVAPDQLLLKGVTRTQPGSRHWIGVAEDWLTLDRPDVESLLPSSNQRIGDSWQVPGDVAEKILTHVYPPTGQFDPTTHTFQDVVLTCEIIDQSEGSFVVELFGKMTMNHDLLRPDEHRVRATVVGYFRIAPGAQRPTTFRLSTFEAEFAGGPFETVFYDVSR